MVNLFKIAAKISIALGVINLSIMFLISFKNCTINFWDCRNYFGAAMVYLFTFHGCWLLPLLGLVFGLFGLKVDKKKALIGILLSIIGFVYISFLMVNLGVDFNGYVKTN